jgi:hypothetical protein
MGVKGLSKNVIKLAWRSGKLSELAEGTTIGVDAMGWIHKAIVANAEDIVKEKASSVGHHAVFIRYVQQLLHHKLRVVIVLDGRLWPLKKAERSKRQNKRAEAREKAFEAEAARDPVAAAKFFKQAVPVPDAFVSWIVQHCSGTDNVSVVVANYEADAQLAHLRVRVMPMPRPRRVLPASCSPPGRPRRRRARSTASTRRRRTPTSSSTTAWVTSSTT